MKIRKLLLLSIINIIFLTACEMDEDEEIEPDKQNAVAHQSFLTDNSGWSSIAFDDEVFYPFGGFSGFKTIELAESFVVNGKPHAIASYYRQFASGFAQDLMRVENNSIERSSSIKINSSKNYFFKDDDLYSYIITDENEVDLARINGPDFLTYNSFQYDLEGSRLNLSREDYTLGNFNNPGQLDLMVENNEPHIVNCNYLVIRENSSNATSGRLVMASKNISANLGSIERIGILPFNSDVDQEAFITMESQSIGKVVMSVAVLSQSQKGLFLIGSFDNGFSYIQTIDNVRRVVDFFSGIDHFFCILEKFGSSEKHAYKIDKAGTVTTLGIITDVYDDGFAHYKGNLVAAINEGIGTTESKIAVQKITAVSRENLGASLISSTTPITHLMSDGNRLFAAAENRTSPKYQGGGRQFHGWEFVEYLD